MSGAARGALGEPKAPVSLPRVRVVPDRSLLFPASGVPRLPSLFLPLRTARRGQSTLWGTHFPVRRRLLKFCARGNASLPSALGSTRGRPCV